jgi:hypothetical protein
MKTIALAALAVLAFAGLAAAQDTVVDVDAGAVDYLVRTLDLLIEPLLALVVLPLVWKGFAYIGVKLDEGKRDSLVATMRNTASGYLNELGEEAKTLKLDVRDPRLAKYVRDAQKRAPDALRWAGLNEAEIARRLVEQVAQQVAAGTPVEPVASVAK